MARKRRSVLTLAEVAARWNRQAEMLVNTIREIHESPTGHGLKWTRSMILHYAKKYYELREKTPRRCILHAKMHDKTIVDIIAKYPVPEKK